MSADANQKLQQTLSELDEQRKKLGEIERRYHSGYQVLFDANGAAESVNRWRERTARLLEDKVCAEESMRFRHIPAPLYGVRDSWSLKEWLDRFDAFLLELLNDILEHPDDPRFDRLSSALGLSNNNPSSKGPPPLTKTYDVFLSYCTADKDEAREIYAAVIKRGKTCFLSEKSLTPGDSFQDKIRDALEASKEVWILVSPNSVKSEWVQREVSAAWGLRKKIVPILLRCSPQDLPSVLSSMHAIDFHKAASLVAGLA